MNIAVSTVSQVGGRSKRRATPALLILGFWFLQQIFFGVYDVSNPAGGGGGGVAYFAHIGGFAFGLVAIKLFASERRRRRQIERVGGFT